MRFVISTDPILIGDSTRSYIATPRLDNAPASGDGTLGRYSSVHGDDRSCRVGRTWRRQVDEKIGHFFHGSGATERILRQQLCRETLIPKQMGRVALENLDNQRSRNRAGIDPNHTHTLHEAAAPPGPG